MPTLVTTQITLYAAYRNGTPRGFGLDRDEVIREFKIRPNCERMWVETTEKVAGVARGVIFQWTPGSDAAPKLHWYCPACGQQWWEDWSLDRGRPILMGSGCRCVDLWLIDWYGM